MTVSTGKQVAIEYTLTLGDNEIVDTNVDKEPLVFVHGKDQVLTGLESALEGMTAGESKKVVLEPEEAYGQVIQDALIKVPLDQLPDDVREEGALVQGKNTDGQMIRGQVDSIEEDEATIDFNHPLAGKTLHFDVKILSVEDASA